MIHMYDATTCKSDSRRIEIEATQSNSLAELFPMGVIPDMLTAQLILNASWRPVRWCPLSLPHAFVDA